jgi:hypothetical protein
VVARFFNAEKNRQLRADHAFANQKSKLLEQVCQFRSTLLIIPFLMRSTIESIQSATGAMQCPYERPDATNR